MPRAQGAGRATDRSMKDMRYEQTIHRRGSPVGTKQSEMCDSLVVKNLQPGTAERTSAPSTGVDDVENGTSFCGWEDSDGAGELGEDGIQ